MATLTISAGALTATRTVSNADVTRIKTAAAGIFPDRTEQQLIDYVMDRLLQQIIAMTKSYERSQQAVTDIIVT